VREGIITQAQWDKAFAIYRQRGGFVGQWLVDLGFIAHDTLTSFLVKKLNLPFLNILDYDIDPEVLKIIPKEICLAHHLLPLDRLGRILSVAMVDPLDEEAIEKVRRLCPDLHIERILCDWRHFTQVAARRSAKEDARELDLETLGLDAGRSADNVDASAQSGKTFSTIQPIVQEAIQDAVQIREPLPQMDNGRQQQEVRAEEPSPHTTPEALSAPGTDPLPPVIEMSLTGYDIRKEVLALIPRDICLEYRVLPIEKLGRVLAVAMVEPRDAAAVHEVRVRCPGLRIKAVPCPAEEFDRLAAQYLDTDAQMA
jgi:type II secretory ATPase GspE/PulE/Tfp pilus assembly ATPase PilB-like protein